MNSGFVLFGPYHLAVLVIVAVTGLLLSQIVRLYPYLMRTVYIILASVLLTTLISSTAYRFTHGMLPPEGFPLHVSDMTAIIVFITLITRRQRCFEVSYYWGFSVGSLALFTPSLECDITCVSSIMYFMIHGVVVISVMIFVWGEKRSPTSGSLLRAFVALNGYAVMMGIFDVIFKTNYFYMLHKPQGETLMSLFGPWPFYILVTDAFSFVIFSLLWLPYRKKL